MLFTLFSEIQTCFLLQSAVLYIHQDVFYELRALCRNIHLVEVLEIQSVLQEQGAVHTFQLNSNLFFYCRVLYYIYTKMYFINCGLFVEISIL